MNCQKCNKDFEEKEIQESHDVPCYLFYDFPDRRERKQHADKFNRRWLCFECHQKYEKNLNLILKARAIKFGEVYFEDDTETT